MPTRRQDTRGPAVKALQALPTARGRSVPGDGVFSADGVYSAGVTAKANAFRKAARLTADGVAGTPTCAALLAARTGASEGGRGALARRVLATGGITLATVRPGGRHAGSTARRNIVDKPDRRVSLDARMPHGRHVHCGRPR
ncbi:peptidoglycan hydrolase-like protein with peptidoglycan-binding domain [Streptomyces glaucescens]